MSPTKKQTAFRIEAEILDGLQAVKVRDGIPLSEQVRRALKDWLSQKAVIESNTVTTTIDDRTSAIPAEPAGPAPSCG